MNVKSCQAGSGENPELPAVILRGLNNHRKGRTKKREISVKAISATLKDACGIAGFGMVWPQSAPGKR